MLLFLYLVYLIVDQKFLLFIILIFVLYNKLFRLFLDLKLFKHINKIEIQRYMTGALKKY